MQILHQSTEANRSGGGGAAQVRRLNQFSLNMDISLVSAIVVLEISALLRIVDLDGDRRCLAWYQHL